MKKIIYGDRKNIICESLRSLRLERKLTQEELAAKMQTYNNNIDQQMISKIENNARIVTDYELVCFSFALNVSVQELLQHFYDNVSFNK